MVKKQLRHRLLLFYIAVEPQLSGSLLIATSHDGAAQSFNPYTSPAVPDAEIAFGDPRRNTPR